LPAASVVPKLRTPSPQSPVTAAPPIAAPLPLVAVRLTRFNALWANAPPITLSVIWSRDGLTLFMPSVGRWYSGSVV
jgi:hypothetical protein